MKHHAVVVALGGNALLGEHDSGSDQEQGRRAEAVCRILAVLVRRRLDLVVVHGNGPQVGNLLLQMEEAALKVPPSGLDVAVALSQGSMGYLLERALRNQLHRRHIAKEVVTLVSMVVVDEDVEALRPTKPVGPFLTRHRAAELRRRRSWTVVEDAGRGWRKVVASPRPVQVLNAERVREALAQGHVVIAGGGGGIPVRRGPTGLLHGVEAVIDKDHTAALLAREIQASLLVVLTGVGQVFLHHGSEREQPLAAVSASEMKRYLGEGHFAAGSMAPKVEAVLDFLGNGGSEAIITDARSLRAALGGRAGTRVYRDKFR